LVPDGTKLDKARKQWKMRQTFESQLESDDSSSDASNPSDYSSQDERAFEATRAPKLDPIDGHLTDEEASNDSDQSDRREPFKSKQ